MAVAKAVEVTATDAVEANVVLAAADDGRDGRIVESGPVKE